MDNIGKVISKKEVTETLVRNIVGDQEEFKDSISILSHGQKSRLINAMAMYPLVDTEFDQSEPELRVSLTVWKRISDSLVALGTEAAIEGIINGFSREQQQNELNGLMGGENGETKE
jgi:flagellar motor component MotA